MVSNIVKICKHCGFEQGIHTDEKIKELKKCKKCDAPFETSTIATPEETAKT